MEIGDTKTCKVRAPYKRLKRKLLLIKLKENKKERAHYGKKERFRKDQKRALEVRGKLGSGKEIGNCSDICGVLSLIKRCSRNIGRRLRTNVEK